MNLFTKSEYALDEADFLANSTDHPHSVIACGEDSFVVMPTSIARLIIRKDCLLETINPTKQLDLFGANYGNS